MPTGITEPRAAAPRTTGDSATSPPSGGRPNPPPRLGSLQARAGAREDWLQVIPFCVIGAMGAAVNMAVYVGQVHLAHVAPLVAATVAFYVAVAHNYLANRRVTFRHRRGDFVRQGSRFALVSTIALVINLALLAGLLEVMDSIAAQAVAILLVTPVNFLGNRLWSFAEVAT